MHGLIDCVLENSENSLSIIHDILQKDTNPSRQVSTAQLLQLFIMLYLQSALFQVVSVLMENKTLMIQPSQQTEPSAVTFDCAAGKD